MSDTSVQPEYLTRKEAAAYLGVTHDWLQRRAAELYIPAYKFGGHVRYKRSTLDAWAAQQTITPQP